jgi:hypothetical protein
MSWCKCRLTPLTPFRAIRRGLKMLVLLQFSRPCWDLGSYERDPTIEMVGYFREVPFGTLQPILHNEKRKKRRHPMTHRPSIIIASVKAVGDSER